MWSPGLDFQAGGGETAVDQVGPVLDFLQPALDDADQAVQVGGGEVGHGPLEQRPDALRRIKIRRVRGQPYTRSQALFSVLTSITIAGLGALSSRFVSPGPGICALIQDGLRPHAEIKGGNTNPMPRSTAAR